MLKKKRVIRAPAFPANGLSRVERHGDSDADPSAQGCAILSS